MHFSHIRDSYPSFSEKKSLTSEDLVHLRQAFEFAHQTEPDDFFRVSTGGGHADEGTVQSKQMALEFQGFVYRLLELPPNLPFYAMVPWDDRFLRLSPFVMPKNQHAFVTDLQHNSSLETTIATVVSSWSDPNFLNTPPFVVKNETFKELTHIEQGALGNCMFWSISHALFRNNSAWHAIRLLYAIAHMRSLLTITEDHKRKFMFGWQAYYDLGETDVLHHLACLTGIHIAVHDMEDPETMALYPCVTTQAKVMQFDPAKHVVGIIAHSRRRQHFMSVGGHA